VCVSSPGLSCNGPLALLSLLLATERYLGKQSKFFDLPLEVQGYFPCSRPMFIPFLCFRHRLRIFLIMCFFSPTARRQARPIVFSAYFKPDVRSTAFPQRIMVLARPCPLGIAWVLMPFRENSGFLFLSRVSRRLILPAATDRRAI